MPSCKKCGKQAATSEFRRSPKGGYLCLDKIGCAHDLRIKKQGGKPGPRGLQSMFRF
jgi:hypothetical protein